MLWRFSHKRIGHIPNGQVLWRTIYKEEQLYPKTSKVNPGKPKPAFFRDRSGLSCDLAILSTKEKSRLGYGNPPRPAYSGLAQFTVDNVRCTPVSSDVHHAPVHLNGEYNYAHSMVNDYLDGKRADEMVIRCTIPIPFSG